MKRIIGPFLLTLVPALLVPAESHAADHYDAYDGDFVASDNERHHDIVDVFTFPSADKSRLVMIMNTYNRANKLSMFDDKLAYSFRVMTKQPAGEKDREYRFTCRFSGGDEPRQYASCNAYKIESDGAGRKATSYRAAKVEVDKVSSGKELRVFAGRRADAFFGDAGGLGEMLGTRKLPAAFKASPDTNVGARNVTSVSDDLSIVLEVDFLKVFGEKATVFRVAAETGYPTTKPTAKAEK